MQVPVQCLINHLLVRLLARDPRFPTEEEHVRRRETLAPLTLPAGEPGAKIKPQALGDVIFKR